MKTSWEMSSAWASFFTRRADVVKTMSWYRCMNAAKSAGAAGPGDSFCTGGSSFISETRGGVRKLQKSRQQKSPPGWAGPEGGWTAGSQDVTLFAVVSYIKALPFDVGRRPQAQGQ